MPCKKNVLIRKNRGVDPGMYNLCVALVSCYPSISQESQLSKPTQCPQLAARLTALLLEGTLEAGKPDTRT